MEARQAHVCSVVGCFSVFLGGGHVIRVAMGQCRQILHQPPLLKKGERKKIEQTFFSRQRYLFLAIADEMRSQCSHDLRLKGGLTVKIIRASLGARPTPTAGLSLSSSN